MTAVHTIKATNGPLTATAELEVKGAIPSTLAVAAGNYQSAAPRTAYAKPLVARLQDQHRQPLAGQPVTFTVQAGSAQFGSSRSAVSTTDSSGLASAPPLTAGAGVGPVAVLASAGSASTTFVAAVTAKPATPADLKVKVKAPSKVAVGKTFRTKVKVINAGPGRVSDTLLSVSIPDRFSIRDDDPGRRVGNVILYRIGSIGANRDRTVTIKLRARSAGKGTILATTMSSVRDPHLSNNTGRRTIRAR